jgi:Family of unknown function (DUF5924)
VLSLRQRADRLWGRHRTLILMVHTAWALAAGTVVVLLARERYHLVPWVVLFLVVVWSSTLYFGRAATSNAPERPGVAHEVASYVTRVLYQETLFFLLPFYAYSTVLGSPNVVFLAILGGLAVLSCIDLIFDRWLRTRPVFALLFFTFVAFAAVNLLLPLLVGLRPRFAAPAAALLAVGGAVPLAMRPARKGRGARLRLLAAAGVMLAVPLGLPSLIPPVPLRLDRATFSSGIERSTLTQTDTLVGHVVSADVGRTLIVVAEVFAPKAVPTNVRLEWWRDGQLVRLSREVGITAHAAGFRVWDSWHPADGPVPPGRYRVVLRTDAHRVFGIAKLTIDTTRD